MVNPETLTVAKLKAELEKLGQPTAGLKAALVTRLKEALAGGGGEGAAAADPAPKATPPAKQSPAQKKQMAVKSPDPKTSPSAAKGRGAKKAAEVSAPKEPEPEPEKMDTDDVPEAGGEGEGDGSLPGGERKEEAKGAEEEEEEKAGSKETGPAKKRQKSQGGDKGGGHDRRNKKGGKKDHHRKGGRGRGGRGGGGGGGRGGGKRIDEVRRGGLTVSSIESDKLMKTAARVWRRKEGEPLGEWEEEVVTDIYASELGGGARKPSLQRVQLLEISQYLEQYLWPHFDAETSSATHILSIVMMVNEKYREGVNAWTPFHATNASDPNKFASFFRRVMAVKSERELTVSEKTAHLVFLIHVFQSLEDEMVRGVALPLVSLPLWANLSPGRLQLELSKNAQLEKHWRYLMKKEAKAVKAAAKGGEPHAPLRDRQDVAWLPALVDEFLKVCEGALGGNQQGRGAEGGGRGGGGEEGEDGAADGEEGGDGVAGGKQRVHRQSIQYCERFVEFVIDLLSQLPTRRFVRTLLDDRQLLVKSRMVPLHSHPAGRLYGQLVDLFRFYHGFEINDHTGAPLTDEDVASTHCDRLLQLQRLCFKHVEKLRELALSHCGAVEKRPVLTQHLSALDAEELHRLATRQLRLVDPEDPWASDPAFLLEVIVSAFEKRRSQRQAINEMPLYPNEDVLWDENVVPSVAYTGEGCLALPKLNLQFLTFHDYLLRNFNLFRLEATYEIREDIADVLRRVGPHRDPETGAVKFSGWARMATPVALGALAVTEVSKPNVGEAKPAAVTCEVRIDLNNLRGPVREEWDQIKQHDVLFLLAAEGPSGQPQGQGHPGQPQGQRTQQQNPAERYGLKYVRGAEVIEVRDGDGRLFNDFTGRVKPEDAAAGPGGTERTYVLALDTAQYQLDVNRLVEEQGDDVYAELNLLMRRKPKENNFKAILECIRDLMNSDCVVPEWLHDIFLGYGDPAAAQSDNMPNQLRTVDFKDTFLDAEHLREAFPGREVAFTSVGEGQTPVPPFRVTFTPPAADEDGDGGEEDREKRGGGKRGGGGGNGEGDAAGGKTDEKRLGPLLVESYVPPDPGPYPEDQPNLNQVRFTPVQVEAIRNGVQPGLTMVVGPPGTGKTDTATQILHCLYHNEPGQRTLLITHSNAALNDLFQKLMQRDVPARYLLRLGQGESDLDTDLDFSRVGRVNAMLTRRLELLSEVEKLATCLGVPEDAAYTCETAGHFWLLHVLSRWEKFEADAEKAENPGFVVGRFPFTSFFANAPQPLFGGESLQADMRKANGCMRHIRTMFTELEECRAFELLKGMGDRSNYLLTKQAKVVAMTCTHAALKRHDFLRLGFKYDNLVMEESAQILEIETFIPMLLQKTEDGHSRLKRVVLIGDHHQLPPVVKNVAFQKYCNMDQSLFARFVRLGTPYIELNAQGRARPQLSALYSWRYRSLGDLPSTNQGAYTLANPGFAHELQFVDVGDYNGVGETEPTPHFLQNLGEAEYLVSVFQYMRLLGYPASKISIITTYRGQKHLIRDVVARRCASHPLFGTPKHITTVDKFQGQQNDFILLSLVRTKSVGHLRDVRRLVVATSRARLGLYVFGRRALYQQCYELSPAFKHLLKFPTKLAVVPTESYPPAADGTARSVSDKTTPYLVGDAVAMGTVVNQLALKWQQEQMAAAAAHVRQIAPMPPVVVPLGDAGGGEGEEGDDNGEEEDGEDDREEEDGEDDGDDGDGVEGGDADMEEAGDGDGDAQ